MCGKTRLEKGQAIVSPTILYLYANQDRIDFLPVEVAASSNFMQEKKKTHIRTCKKSFCQEMCYPINR